MQRVDREAPATDEISFGTWLRQHGQGARAIEAAWDLIGVATLNAHADDASLALAATVFQLGLLTDARAGDLGWSRVPLQQLHGDPAAAELARLGADVRLGAKVDEITPDHTVRLRDGEAISADAVVLAVPAAAAARLLPEGATSLPAGWAERLGGVPIVNVHLTYDRKVLDEPFIAGLGSMVPWVFDCTDRTGVSDGQALTLPMSAAQQIVDLPVAELRAGVQAALAGLLPRTRQARLLEFFVTREREATFSPAAGNGALRPGPVTSVPGLMLAGAWTDTGWPATMEGAVRSGEAAASAVLSHLRTRSGDRVAQSSTDGVPA
jgi:squalene-associated FAD-dependent desaturase